MSLQETQNNNNNDKKQKLIIKEIIIKTEAEKIRRTRIRKIKIVINPRKQ